MCSLSLVLTLTLALLHEASEDARHLTESLVQRSELQRAQAEASCVATQLHEVSALEVCRHAEDALIRVCVLVEDLLESQLSNERYPRVARLVKAIAALALDHNDLALSGASEASPTRRSTSAAMHPE